MSGASKKLMGTTAVGGSALPIEDVFSTYVYDGTSSAQTITNGIDLAGEGGLVWARWRSGTYAVNDHNLFDTERGVGKSLASNTTDGQLTLNAGLRLTSFNSDGYSIGATSASAVNTSGAKYVSWTWRKAPRFFDCVTWTGTGTSQNIAHNLGVAPGCIIAKNISRSGDGWRVYHRSRGATEYAMLQHTTGFAASASVWNNTEPTDSVFTVGTEGGINESGQNYVAYLFAHDPLGPSGDGSDGLIACGSYVAPSDNSTVSIELGWEPQFFLVKKASSTSDWVIIDNMRGMAVDSWQSLSANLTNSEETKGYQSVIPRATGVDIAWGNGAIHSGGDATHIYIAIRRGPMRQPEIGTDVFAGVKSSTSISTGFPVDAYWIGTGTSGTFTRQRITGGTPYLQIHSSTGELVGGDAGFDNNTGLNMIPTSTWMNWMFRRAPGFFDAVVWNVDGTGNQTIKHNLGVVPEMVISKNRNSADTTWGAWWVGHNGLPGWDSANENDRHALQLNTSNASGQQGYHRDFTDTSIRMIGPASGGYTTTDSTIAYLFATLPGVSKVGSYTGNGSSQTIDCGFTSGARFVLIKRVDDLGEWNVFDSERGIVTGNDPYLRINTTLAEATAYDPIDPASSGFIVNTGGPQINASGASYIFLAIA